MKISIAMATYNGAKYINEQLRSFASQSRKPDELIVSDDGSTDETASIVEAFARGAPFPVRYFRNDKEPGYAGNFNAALTRTTGDLVFLSDQDDVWFDEKLGYMEQLAAENPDKLLFMNDAALTDGDLNEVGLTKLGQIKSAGLPDTWFIMGCCCAVRRELLTLCLPIPERYKAHDNWLVPFAEGIGARVVTRKVLQYYRRHGSNESDFVANQVRRITPWDLARQQLRQVDPKTKLEQQESQIEQLTLFCSGVERAIERSDGAYSDRLQQLLHTKREFIKLLKSRAAIRAKPLPARLLAVYSCWKRGDYRKASGLKSAARDIVGR